MVRRRLYHSQLLDKLDDPYGRDSVSESPSQGINGGVAIAMKDITSKVGNTSPSPNKVDKALRKQGKEVDEASSSSTPATRTDVTRTDISIQVHCRQVGRSKLKKPSVTMLLRTDPTSYRSPVLRRPSKGVMTMLTIDEDEEFDIGMYSC